MLEIIEQYVSVTVLVLLFAFLLLLHSWYKRPANFPPGPRGIPLFGVLPFIAKCPEQVIANWGKVYGSIFSVRIGYGRLDCSERPRCNPEGLFEMIWQKRPVPFIFGWLSCLYFCWMRRIFNWRYLNGFIFPGSSKKCSCVFWTPTATAFVKNFRWSRNFTRGLRSVLEVAKKVWPADSQRVSPNTKCNV